MVEIKELGESSSIVENEAMSTDEPVEPDENEQQANGEVEVDQQQVPVENAQQPSKLEQFFAISKSMILRALIFYFITSFFRRPAPTPADQAGTAAPVKMPAFNYFENGSVMVNEFDEF